MKKIATFAIALLVAGCLNDSDIQTSGSTNAEKLSARSPQVIAFEALRASAGDTKAEIWTDPNGCHHYLAIRSGKGHLQPLLSEDGMPICGK